MNFPLIYKTTEQRSSLMKKIKGTETKVEVEFRKRLWALGYRYRKNYKKLPGTPDIVFTRHKVVVFIDGTFWHGYNWEEKKRKIKSNANYWIPKIEKNMERDRFNNIKLQEAGWVVLRFWDTQVKRDMDGCINQVIEASKSPRLSPGA